MSGSHLADLREELVRAGVDGCIVPRADEHLGEYVPPSAERLAWLTGFTGSAGVAIVLSEQACLFVDGRYVLQAEQQTDPAQWQRRHLIEEPPSAWLGKTAAGRVIGYDPMLLSEESVQRFEEAGCTLRPLAANPIDAIWHDRPAPPRAAAWVHPAALAGKSAAEKREAMAQILRDAKQDAAIVTDPASVAWLLNLRGADLAFTPVALGFAVLHADATVGLFMAPQKLDGAVREALGNAVSVQDPSALAGALEALAGKRVRVDAAASPAWFAQRLRAAGATVVAGPDPCILAKAQKNAVEQQGARLAHRRDAVALCRFLHWFATERPAGVTESQAATHLLRLRRHQGDFRDESFPAISAAGPHGAIMHYRVDAASDREIGADEFYLIDSGAQFPCGTTDVTRTLWTGPGTPSAALRDRYTRVLQGHVAIATLLFPHGTTGAHLDAFARRALWQAGLDFDHGTGHGVGSFLSVHEGPVSISKQARPVPLEAGMILSNEPGFYLPGAYGIRLENLVLVQPADVPGDRKFLRMETLTLAPFERTMIDAAMLLPAERAWLDAYHARVLAEIGPELPEPARAWLDAACAPLDVP